MMLVLLFVLKDQIQRTQSFTPHDDKVHFDFNRVQCDLAVYC